MEPDRRCGAMTLGGNNCRQKVSEGETKCWQHRGPLCSVCLGPMTTLRPNRKLECGHEFHTRCLDRWKASCTGPDPTCPMCRVPFDVPTYRCRLIIERVCDERRDSTNFQTNNVASIIEGFGIDFRTLVPPTSSGRFYADIHFDIDPEETLRDVLAELGLPDVHYD